MTAAPADDRLRPLLAFDGRADELFRIHVVNLALTLLTLGVYRFWAKTRIRRYLWTRTGLLGDRLEYTGTGRELFLGFLIVVVLVLVPVFGGLELLEFVLAAESPELAYLVDPLRGLTVLFLIPVAIFRARRYRLTRSQWRGVRAGQTGSAWAYGAMSLLAFMVTAITFGLSWPLCSAALTSYKLNNTWFGDRRLRFEGRGGPLYGTFFKVTAVYAVLFVLVLWLAQSFVTSLPEVAHPPGAGIVPADGGGFRIGAWQVLLVLGLILAVPVLRIPWYWYQAAEHRYFAGRTRLDGLRFAADVTGASLARLIFGNALIVVFTLGLGLPLARIRSGRFVAERLEVAGEMDVDAVVQSSLARPRTGEGLAEAFDVGGI